jgi:hypothetical protein
MAEPRQLTEKELEARKEIVIPIKPKELWNAYTKYVFEKPLEGLQWAAKKLDSMAVSKKLRSGPLAFLGMPAGIIGRNAARATHHLSTGKYLHTAQWLGGGAAALASWYVAGTALAATLGNTAVAAIGGKIAVTAIAAAVTVPVMVPAAMIGVAGFSLAVGAVIAGISLAPAALNLITGTRRTIDYVKGFRGVDYDGAKEKLEIDYNSLRAIEERKAYQEVKYTLGGLSEEHQKDIYEGLAQRFAKAATKAAEQDDAAPVALPAAKAGITVTPKP